MKKIALIGCGGIGRHHTRCLIQFDDIEIVGMCDLVLSRAEDFLRRYVHAKHKNCRAFSDYREMYDDAKPDAVFVCVPPNVRGVIEFEAIKRGIHLFVEKPMTLDLPLAFRIRDAMAAKGIINAVGLQCRYDDINEPAREYVKNHRIIGIQGSRVGGAYDRDWWRVKSQGGGQLAETSIHQMDMIRYLLGVEPEEVFSYSRRGIITNEMMTGYDADDLSVTAIRFTDGTLATFTAGCYSETGASWDNKILFGALASRMEYTLTKKTVIYGLLDEDMEKEDSTTVKGDGTQNRNENEQGIVYRSTVDLGVLCDRAFVDAVITGDSSKIRSPYADAVKSLAFVLACNKSMETGLPVKVAL